MSRRATGARKTERITLPLRSGFACASPGKHSARRFRIDKQEVAGSIPACPTITGFQLRCRRCWIRWAYAPDQRVLRHCHLDVP
jgi:hypothetical protein